MLKEGIPNSKYLHESHHIILDQTLRIESECAMISGVSKGGMGAMPPPLFCLADEAPPAGTQDIPHI